MHRSMNCRFHRIRTPWPRTKPYPLAVALFFSLLCLQTLSAQETKQVSVEIDGRTFSLPEGYTIERIVPESLVERPIHAAFDEAGNLYVTESNGTNDPVADQLEQRPHRVLRLQDTDHDGFFDTRTVFADQMMFPEGAMWFDGSLYVSAPPAIWKLTDTDADGIADEREEWFNGGTLTGCANDLHGPYLGRDGWIYWCKGAFAEQTYHRLDGTPWKTRAAHIFRKRPSGDFVEPVMTGGMDNPVDVVFTPTGERVFNTTFLQHPGGGRRDGLIHAIYGGVYGKSHGVLDGHPRTGGLMPVLVHLGAAAPSGLHLIDSERKADGSSAPAILATSFNMHKITRHRLHESEATFETEDDDFLVTDDLDFHPTDIIEDADGSFLVVDTGGWYKLCCPTSQLWKPDVTGAIYRVRRIEQEKVADPRGIELDWESYSAAELASLLDDDRFAVRMRATQVLAKLDGAVATKELANAFETSESVRHRLEIVWALSWVDHPDARSAVRGFLSSQDSSVVHAALHVISVWRDREAAKLCELVLLNAPQLALQRVAAEALGRIGSGESTASIIKAVKFDTPRELEHSLIYALIEIGDVPALRALLPASDPWGRRALVIALSQIDRDALSEEDVIGLLDSDVESLRSTIENLASEHPEWTSINSTIASDLLEHSLIDPTSSSEVSKRLSQLLGDIELQRALAERVASEDCEALTRTMVLRALQNSQSNRLDSTWKSAIKASLESESPETIAAVLNLLQAKEIDAARGDWIDDVGRIASDEQSKSEHRLSAIRVMSRAGEPIDESCFEFLCEQLHNERPSSNRAIASEILAAHSRPSHLGRLIEAMDGTGPVELIGLLEIVARLQKDTRDGAFELTLLRQLDSHPATSAVPLELLGDVLKDVSADRHEYAESILVEARHIDEERLAKIQRVMKLADSADVRRGQEVFHGTKASCAACHALGYLGGDIGPDLSRIGRIRSNQDLLESIIFPSATFVRSYEPVTIVTIDGEVLNGLLRNETDSFVELLINEELTRRVAREDIEERQLGTVSIMPAGLDQQLTDQELADLVKFLMTAN